MKVLFSALHFGYFRNFESVITALADRGHRVHLAADEPDIAGGQGLVERLSAAHEGITWGWTPNVQDEPWFVAAQKARYGLDYVRFLDSRYEDAPKLRLRARTPRQPTRPAVPVVGFERFATPYSRAHVPPAIASLSAAGNRPTQPRTASVTSG